MKGSAFEYIRPETCEEACELKDQFSDNAIFWAGGTDLLPLWKDGIISPQYCIDISEIADLIHIVFNNSQFYIGAATNLSDIEASSILREKVPSLGEVSNQMATPQLRNLATIGGNICNASPAADLAVALLALDAKLKLLSVKGERFLALSEFFHGRRLTAIRQNELLAEIIIPLTGLCTTGFFKKVGRTSVDIALANVSAAIIAEKNIITETRISMGAVASRPIRALAAEKILIGMDGTKLNDFTLREVSSKASDEAQPVSDMRAPVAYRREIVKVIVKRALDGALKRTKV